MSKGDWIFFWGIVTFAVWYFYQNSKKTPAERFFYKAIEDVSEDELETALL